MRKFEILLLFNLLLSSHFLKATQPSEKYRSCLKNSSTNFLENKGQVKQTDGKSATYVSYVLERGDVNIYLFQKAKIAWQISRVNYSDTYLDLVKSRDPENLNKIDSTAKNTLIENYRMDMELVDANPTPKIITEGRSKDYVNYYNYKALDVHHYEKVIYKEVYPGIDWVIYTTDNGLKYDFIVSPGADPSMIKLKFTDHEELYIDKKGRLIHANRLGKFTEESPVSFQADIKIETLFQLRHDIVSFKVAEYDISKTLVIDPARLWATYYGGGSTDLGLSCSSDNSGNLFLVGYTQSTNAISQNGFQNSFSGSGDAYVVKFNSNGIRQWASYYGGSGRDRGESCSVDNSGNVYLAGQTQSTNNIALNGHQNTINGGTDAFLVKFNSNGIRQWGTYYGGTDGDRGESCTVDNFGNIYLAGSTQSTNNIFFNGHQSTHGNPGSQAENTDAFLVKFNSNGIRQWGTYYGGNFQDEGFSCASDLSGNIFLTGLTESPNSIAQSGHQNNYGGNGDAFIVKFNSNGIRQWGTYYGGSAGDRSESCSVDNFGNIYLAGNTLSNNGISLNGYQNTLSGIQSSFLVKFSNNGNRIWATYFGPSSDGFCAVDNNNNVYLCGEAGIGSNLAVNGFQSAAAGADDAFLAKFNSTGNLQWSTYYGGDRHEGFISCSADPLGNVFLSGSTASLNGISFNGHQNTYGGTINNPFIVADAFLVKFGECTPSQSTNTLTACNSYTWNGQTYTQSGNYSFQTTTSVGCDSTANLILTIKSNLSSTISITACDSYTWNGQTYTQSGNYSFQTTTSVGCDSTANLILTIGNSSSSTISETACGVYIWNGQSFNQSGTYTLNTTNANGCDSIITANITIYPDTSVVISNTTCNPANAGSSIQSYTNRFGCDSVVSLITTYIPPNSIILSQSTCLFSEIGVDSMFFSNQYGCDSTVIINKKLNPQNLSRDTLFTCNPQLIDIDSSLLSNQFSCDSLVITTILLTQPDSTFISINTCDSNLVGVDTSYFINQIGCDSIVYNSYSLFTTDTTFLNLSSCDSSLVGVESVNLTSSLGCDSIIITNTGFILPDTFLISNYTCDSLLQSTDTNIYVNLSGCDSIVIQSLIYQPEDITSISSATCDSSQIGVDTAMFSNQYGCDSIVINTTTYSSFDIDSDTSYTCDPLLVGIDTTVLANQYGCDSLVISVINLSGSDTIYISNTTCDSLLVGIDTLLLQNQYGCDSLIYLDIQFSSSIVNTFIDSTCDISLSGIDTARYLNQLGCDSLVITEVVYIPPDTTSVQLSSCDSLDVGIDTSFLTNQSGCGSLVIISTTYLPLSIQYESVNTCTPSNAGVDTTFFLGQNGCDSILLTEYIYNAPDTVIENFTTCDSNSIGSEYLIQQGQNGCDSIVQIITRSWTPTSKTESDLYICENDSILLGGDYQSNSGIYIDSFKTQFGCDSIIVTNLYVSETSNDTSFITLDFNDLYNGFEIKNDTVIKNTLININGCDSIITTFIKIEEGVFYIPNAFSPNGDGTNDIFKPFVLGELKNYRLMIFNRWGEKVFESRNPEQGWDGEYNGSSLSADTYIYSLSITLENKQKRFSGSITLVR